MTPATIAAAKKEARRFLARVKAWEALEKAPADMRPGGWNGKPYDARRRPGPMETGAIRRASMDLTRALSALRKP